MKIFARRTESGLVPVDETGETELRKLRPGTVVSVEVMGRRIESEHFAVKPPRPKQPTPSLAKPKKPLPKKRAEPRRLDAGHVTGGQKLIPIVVDREYYETRHLEPCFITGLRGTPEMPVVAMHIGNCAKGAKNDAECLPALKIIHDQSHDKGITVILDWLRDRPHVLLAILRAYARETYFSQERKQQTESP